MSAVVALALGLALVFAPEPTLSQFGTETRVALFVTILGVAGDIVIRNFGWLVIVVEVVFGLGYVFVLFLQPRMK